MTSSVAHLADTLVQWDDARSRWDAYSGRLMDDKYPAKALKAWLDKNLDRDEVNRWIREATERSEVQK